MNRKTRTIIPSLAALALAVVITPGCNKASAQSANKTGVPRENVQLTIYKEDFAVVREDRPVDLQSGRTRVGLVDISKLLDQDSVMFNWPDKGANADVVASTYDLGIPDSGKLLNKFIGHEVELVTYGQDGHEADHQKGILQVAEPGNIVLKVGDKLLINPPGSIVAPTDQGVVAITQLSADIDSKAGGAAKLGMTYQTRGFSWNADYTATIDPGSDKAKIETWATVTNTTGISYPDAKLRFVAGSPNRATRATHESFKSQEYQAESLARAPAGGAAGTWYSGRPEATGELYAYPVKSTATIASDQMNRVKMNSDDSLPIKRDYSIRLQDLSMYYNGYINNPDARISATLAISFKNDDASGLGAPLPAGAVRVYEPDASGAPQFIGAASIADTPKDASVYLTLSNVFDVYAQEKIVKSQRIDKRTTRRFAEITIHNEKASATDVRIVQQVYGAIHMAEESTKGKKLNSGEYQWTINVPAGGQAKLTYAVDVRL